MHAGTGTGVQFAWYRNGATLTTLSATTHIISSASPADSGVYQCHWYSQQLGTFETHTWGLIITNPGKMLTATERGLNLIHHSLGREFYIILRVLSLILAADVAIHHLVIPYVCA